MNRRNKLLLVIAAAVLLLVVVLSLRLGSSSPKTGTLAITFQLPDDQGLSLKLNNQSKEVMNLNPSYQVAAGTYHLDVSKPGYKDFSSDLTVDTGLATHINITMQRTVIPPASGLDNRVKTDVQIPGLNITATEYFYDKTWAFVTIQTSEGNVGFLVTKYDDTAGTWRTVMGPGTSFDPGDVASLPNDVATYMKQNNYVPEGGSD
jgi:hypothetical protein